MNAKSRPSGHSAVSAILRDKTPFRGLLPDTLAHLARSALLRHLAHDELWTSRTDAASGIALIVEGGLRSTSYTWDGKEHIFSIMKPGDIWGLVSTIDGLHNANDVYAHGPTTLLTIERQVTRDTMESCPDFRQCLTWILCERLLECAPVVGQFERLAIDRGRAF